MSNFVETITEKEYCINVIHPTSESNQVLLALHGWTGAETTMSIFTERIAKNYWVFQPRGFFNANPEGFGWVNYQPGKIKKISDFLQSVHNLRAYISPLIRNYCNPMNNKINLIGFSQGAAMVIAYSLAYPEEINKAAVLAGFLPADTETLPVSPKLPGVDFFISHGTEDTVISIEQAQKAVDYLKTNGAAISYCEGKGGHRVSADCFKDLDQFFNPTN